MTKSTPVTRASVFIGGRRHDCLHRHLHDSEACVRIPLGGDPQ